MRQKTAKLLRKTAKEMGIDPKGTDVERRKYRALKKAHNAAPWPEKARATAIMRKTLAAV